MDISSGPPSIVFQPKRFINIPLERLFNILLLFIQFPVSTELLGVPQGSTEVPTCSSSLPPTKSLSLVFLFTPLHCKVLKLYLFISFILHQLKPMSYIACSLRDPLSDQPTLIWSCIAKMLLVDNGLIF